jgi:hypothetical protein
LRTAAGVPGVARILQRNAYGWFIRIERGTYMLSDGGDAALTRFAGAIAVLPAVSAPVQPCQAAL